MAGIFTIDGSEPQTYLDNSGRPVNGYRVRFTITAYDEGHEVNVPSLDPPVVDKAVRKVVAQRDALAKLGQ